MEFNTYTVMLMFLAVGSNAALSMWLKQGLLGVITAIVLLLIAKKKKKRPHTDNQHK